MTKEQLLKILSAYLPYGLKLQHIYQKAIHKNETILRSWVKPLEPLDLGCLFPHRKDSFDWKPILYDFSYLTKEIEHNGERFVPILKICDFFGLKYSQYTLLENSVDLTLDKKFHRANTKTKEPQKVRLWFSNHKGISFNCTNMGLLMYKDIFGAIQMLLELHFNVFNLPEGDYINKATLK